MFSLITAIFSCTAWPTVCPGANGCSSSAARSAGAFFQTCSAMPLTSAWKSGVFATKSVSQLTSTTTPLRPSAAMWAPTAPSEAVRLPFVAAPGRPLFGRAAAAAVAADGAGGGRAARLLGGRGQPLLAQHLARLRHVAARLHEGGLAVHHAGARLLAELAHDLE